MWDWTINWGVAAYIVAVIYYDYTMISFFRHGRKITVTAGVNGTSAGATMLAAGIIVFHPLASMMMNTVSKNTYNGFYDSVYWFFNTFSIIGIVRFFDSL